MRHASVGSPDTEPLYVGAPDTGPLYGEAPDTGPLHRTSPDSVANPLAGAHMSPAALVDDRYALGTVIGSGGMATVYRAYDRRTHRQVAIKVFQSVADLGDADRRYRREVELQSTLNDPGLVRVLDHNLTRGRPPGAPRYLVTELVEGSTLARRLEEGPLTDAELARLGSALCRTLAHVHDRGIVHRDIKPANILLPGTADDPLSAPKLIDFGIALSADRPRLTSDGATVGTANYLSPEQVRGEPVTPASDIYSLGLVLIEARAGALAYPGSGVEAALARLSRPPSIPPTTNHALRGLLASMVAADPAKRPDARKVAHRLDEAATAGPEIAVLTDVDQLAAALSDATDPLPVAPRRRRRHTIAAVSAAAVVAAGIASGVVTATTSPPPPETQNQPAQPTTTPTTRPPSTPAATPSPARATPVRGSQPPVQPIPAQGTQPAQVTPAVQVTKAPPKHGKAPARGNGHKPPGHGHKH